jgi:hypothetical protein
MVRISQDQRMSVLVQLENCRLRDAGGRVVEATVGRDQVMGSRGELQG